MKFDATNNSTNFLDLNVKISGNQIITDLHRKATDQ